jgi:hypothetical protein
MAQIWNHRCLGVRKVRSQRPSEAHLFDETVSGDGATPREEVPVAARDDSIFLHPFSALQFSRTQQFAQN